MTGTSHKFLEAAAGWIGLAAVSLILSGWPAGALGAEKEKPAQYIGALKCAKMCHRSEKQGRQLVIWQESRHAGAYETLGTPKAKEYGSARGIEDPQSSPQCLKCHITAPDATVEEMAKGFTNTEGIGCERCHGPGSLYKGLSIMKDPDRAIAAGLLIPNEETCRECHNEESPSYTPFDFEERVKKIEHRRPVPEE